MSTRAEEIAAKEYPDLFIRDDKMKTSGTALISDAAQMLRREGFINGYKQGRWISVEERLPDRDVWVWAYSKSDGQVADRYDMTLPNGTVLFKGTREAYREDVTHWMELPPNPEQR